MAGRPQAGLLEHRNVVGAVAEDDPPAIYYMQRQWTTMMRSDIEGFVFNPINIGLYNFYRMSRKA